MKDAMGKAEAILDFLRYLARSTPKRVKPLSVPLEIDIIELYRLVSCLCIRF